MKTLDYILSCMNDHLNDGTKLHDLTYEYGKSNGMYSFHLYGYVDGERRGMARLMHDTKTTTKKKFLSECEKKVIVFLTMGNWKNPNPIKL